MEMTHSDSSSWELGIGSEAAFVVDCSPDGSAQVIRYICRVSAMVSHVSIPFDAGDFSSIHRRVVGWAMKIQFNITGLVGE
jgi:hypothetical protein